MKMLVPVSLIVLGLAGLITMGVLQAGVPELQVQDLLRGAHTGRMVKIHGRIDAIASQERPLRFTVADKNQEDITVAVVCDANKPDTFDLGNDVAVEGTYAADSKVFRGERIYTKCPSKYEGLEKTGLTADGKPTSQRAASRPASRAVRAQPVR